MSRLGRMLANAQRHWTFDHLPRVLPASYRVVETAEDGMKYMRKDHMTVIASGATELDGRKWLHVSCAHPTRLPSWKELMEVKEIFIGRDRAAIQVIPPKAKHINIHPNCLHLWCCLDGEILPDFTQGTGSI